MSCRRHGSGWHRTGCHSWCSNRRNSRRFRRCRTGCWRYPPRCRTCPSSSCPRRPARTVQVAVVLKDCCFIWQPGLVSISKYLDQNPHTSHCTGRETLLLPTIKNSSKSASSFHKFKPSLDPKEVTYLKEIWMCLWTASSKKVNTGKDGDS